MLFWKNKKPKKQPKAKPQMAERPKCVEQGKTEIPIENVKFEPQKETVRLKIKKAEPQKEFLSIFKELTYRHRTWDVWRDFIVMFACALSNPIDKEHYDERENRYLKIVKQYSKKEQLLFPELVAQTVMALEQNPEQDFLGDIFMELNLRNESNGQFFTPYHVCELMAKVTIGEDIANQIREKGYITIHDPCCGSGATLIAGVHAIRKQLEKAGLNYQNHVLVAAQDIDEIVALMCYIQLSLLGVAAYIKVGNSLTEPIILKDKNDSYWFTMMYFSDIWVMRRAFHNMDELKKGETNGGKEII